MNALTGTARLLRLALRLDRLKIFVWLLAIVGIIALTLPQLQSAYGSEKQRVLYATATSSSPVTRLLSGSLTGPSMGEITIVETYVLAAILVGLMNIFMVTRHTRQNEESGRSEMLSSMIVGRQASLSATLLLALLVNGVVSALLFLVYQLNNFPMAGSLAYSLGIGAAGLVFACTAAVTSQLFENTRAANGVAGLVLGISFVIRGVADALGSLRPDGLGVITSNLSWVSPLGWVTNMRPFADERWWVLGLFMGLIFVLITAAYVLLGMRDVGSGLIASRPGKAAATSDLLRSFGLIWRLNRVSFVSWMLSLMAVGATIGTVADEFAELIAGNEEMQKLLASFGGDIDVSNLMFSATFIIIGIIVSGYGLQVLTRMKAEESTARLELTLSTPTSRVMWLAKYLIFALLASALILLLAGVAAGITYAAVADKPESVWRLSTAILVQLPAVSVVIGAGVVVFGLLKRFSTALTWGILAICLLIFQLGALLKLPQWIINLSPFTHTPPAPATSIAYSPLFILLAIAVTLLLIGILGFKRRDIITE